MRARLQGGAPQLRSLRVVTALNHVFVVYARCCNAPAARVAAVPAAQAAGPAGRPAAAAAAAAAAEPAVEHKYTSYTVTLQSTDRVGA